MAIFPTKWRANEQLGGGEALASSVLKKKCILLEMAQQLES